MFYLTTHSTHFIYGYMASGCYRKEGRKYFIQRRTQHILFTVIWRRGVTGRKEGNILFNDALNTFYLRLYGDGVLQEGRKEIFYLTTHSTHFIYGYMASGCYR